MYHYKGNSCKPASASQALRHKECDYMGGGLRVSDVTVLRTMAHPQSSCIA
uniref:Uncharacterized protein n=1 Tax=Escherichia phage vB_EcoM_4HA13 TaxID=2601675 RepID=A0A7D0NGK1_9CAUD